MVKYSKDFKEQALLLPNELEVKKPAEQLGICYHTIAERRKERSQKAKEVRIASDKTPLNNREFAMQREIQKLKKRVLTAQPNNVAAVKRQVSDEETCILICALISARIERLPKFTLCSVVQF